MKNGPLFFLGLFGSLALSWAGVVLSSNGQLGKLAPYQDDNGGPFPERTPGIAARGQLVYQDLNCGACHTQQVRSPAFGSDKDRGWGDRQSVARDYIFSSHVQLGASRIGPDLANLGARKTPYDAEDLLTLLYKGMPEMPAYRFLFETRKVTGQVSEHALKLRGDFAPATGYEVVPSSRARDLVAYLLSLKQTYALNEAIPYEPAPAKEGEHK